MDAHLDTVTLDELRAVLGDEFAVLVNTFLNDSDKRVSALREALSAQDAERMREAAHSFKGSALNMGAHALAALCRDVEARARAGDLVGLGAAVEAIARELGVVSGLLAG